VNEFDPALSAELERLAPPLTAVPDWDEVLSRAAVRRRAAHALAPATLLALVALLAAPALGLLGSSSPGVRFAADLHAVAGAGSGSFTATPLRAFMHRGSKRVLGFTPAFRFTLRFEGLSGPVTSARIRVAPPAGGRTGYTVRLCAPCRSGARLVLIRRGLALALSGGRGTVVVATARHPDGELRGRVRRVG
jgi:hypothetical protein